MRTLPIAAAAAIAIMTAAASAQTPTTPTPRSPGSPATTPPPAQVHKEPAVNPLTKEDVSKIEGTDVYGSDNSKIGHVSRVLMEPDSKKIDRLVVSTGGVLGVGAHLVAIPVDKFTWDADKGVFKLAQTEAQLKAMPEWVEGNKTATGSSTPPSGEPKTGTSTTPMTPSPTPSTPSTNR